MGSAAEISYNPAGCEAGEGRRGPVLRWSNLIASLLIDLSEQKSEQKLYVVNPQHHVVRTMPVSSGRSSSPTPIGTSNVLSRFASVTMRGRDSVTPGVP